MTIDRRKFMAVSTLLLLGGRVGRPHNPPKEKPMYGLIGKINVVEGARDELAEILLDGISEMPGCLSYVVAEDPEDPNGLWVTEVWDSQESHESSLSLPSVREAIRKGRPLIEGFSDQHVTTPLGGHGLREP